MRSKLFALWLLAFSFVPELFAQTGISPPDAGLFNKAVACIKEAEGTETICLMWGTATRFFPTRN